MTTEQQAERQAEEARARALERANIAGQLALHVDRLLRNCARSIEDLEPEQVNHRPGDGCNAIGFDVWHVVRTADNVVHFVFEREQPVWLREGFDDRFGLPKVAQGTGMAGDEAHALVFPPAAEFNRYTDAVREAIVPRIRKMPEDYLREIITIRPWGDISRMEAIGQVLIAHGNGHLGRVSLARSLIGKDDLGI